MASYQSASLTPFLVAPQPDQAIDWYAQVFAARVVMRLTDPQGSVVHAEIQIGDTLVMLAGEDPRFNQSAATLGGTPVILHLTVDHADDVFTHALAAGAKSVFPLADQFYGYRSGRIEDPFGHQWIISQLLESVSTEEMQRRLDELYRSENS